MPRKSMAKRIVKTSFKQPQIRRTYHDLRQSIEARTNEPDSIGLNQADKVHRYWKRLGKLVSQGPAAKIK